MASGSFAARAGLRAIGKGGAMARARRREVTLRQPRRFSTQRFFFFFCSGFSFS